MNILDEIVAKTKSKLEEKKQGVSLEELSSKIDLRTLKKQILRKVFRIKLKLLLLR